jgi:3-methyladenine DNA glycosylase AlkD
MKEYTQKIHSFIERQRNEEVAEAMSHASKGTQKFIGLRTSEMKNVFKTIFSTYPMPKYDDMKNIIREFFAMEEREYLYFGIAMLAKRSKLWQKTDIVFIESMIITQPGWDTTEYISTEILPHFHKKFPKVSIEFLQSWNESKNQWLKAASIMFQRTMKENTDTGILKNFIVKNLGTNDNIINRAIGSALRDYSKTDHQWVIDFVLENSEKMNNKTKQDAIKWIDSKGLIKW